MPSRKIVPAQLGHSPSAQTATAGVPYSPQYDDVYHTAAGAWAQARHVFLEGNGLPGRWQQRDRFVILETGFGLGNNFLATWAAWRADPARCTRLVFVSIEKHPLRTDDLARVHAGQGQQECDEARQLAERLCRAWPPLTPGLHTLDFDETVLPGTSSRHGVSLLLGLGDIADILPSLVASVDAFYLDGFAPAKNPEMWDDALISRLDRLAAPRATAATWSAARGVRDALTRAGFQVEKVPGFGGKRDMTRACFEPRHVPKPLPGGLWPVSLGSQRETFVLGAGLAGAAAAWALTREGWQVTLLDRHAEPAQEASGNPGGLFHGILHAQDSLHARAHRAAALATSALVSPWLQEGRIAGQCSGLLRLEPRLDNAQAVARLAHLGLPDEYVTWLDQAQASRLAQLSLPSGGWLFRQGGWLSPFDYVSQLIETASASGLLRLHLGHAVAQVRRTPQGQWQAVDAQGRLLAEAAHAVLACATTLPHLLDQLGSDVKPAPLPVTPIRGQISWLPGEQARCPDLPVAGAGYVLSLPDGHVLCGATSHHHDADAAVRWSDHHHNLQQATRLGALPEGQTFAPDALRGRVGWRASTPDRLPLVGALPAMPGPLPGGRPWPEQVRKVPRLRDEDGGLYVIGGLGSRGITWATLAGRLLAHWITGSPCPVEVDLRDAMDPARWALRRASLPAQPPF
jgi:tRNA 5-methylaminomethyl-2-thiouridine biosynthesis bifunctional protein